MKGAAGATKGCSPCGCHCYRTPAPSQEMVTMVGLKVEEPSAIKHLRTVEVQAPSASANRTFEPQTFEIDDLLGVCQG